MCRGQEPEDEEPEDEEPEGKQSEVDVPPDVDSEDKQSEVDVPPGTEPEEEERVNREPDVQESEDKLETRGCGATGDEEIQPPRSQEVQSDADGVGELTKDLPPQEEDRTMGKTTEQPAETEQEDGDAMDVNNGNQD